MASHPPGGHQGTFRHRITNVKLDPSTSDYDITIKILVDGRETHRLPPIKQGTPLSWDRMIPCDVRSGSQVEIRVYEKHLFSLKRVGTLEYDVSKVVDQPEASFDFDSKQFKVVLSFPSSDVAKQAPSTALAEAQAKERQTRLLERLGPTRDALKAILDFGQAVSELHPAAKIAFGICKIAWDTLEKQEQCDASVEKLVVSLAGMLPFVDQVDKAAKLSPLRKTVEAMMNLIEDASRFVVEYKSDEGPIQGLRAVVGSNAQVQVQDLLDKFRDLKEEFDRAVGVQTLKKVDAVHEALLTNTQPTMLSKLNPVGSARYASARACLPGTRIAIIQEIIEWSQQRDPSKGLLWVHGQAGLGKSSIATSVCQELDERRVLAGEFFCKRDSSERRDPQQVLKTIIYGLALRHPGYAGSVSDAISDDVGLCSSPINKQYDSLVKGPLEALSQMPLSANLVVVVDALDECGTDESRRQLLAYLHLMSQLVPWLKVVITSRPDRDIQSFFNDRAVSGVSRRNVYKYKASDDIKTFIQHHMDNSGKSTELPPDATHLLTERADGLFIWAETACKLILKDDDPAALFDLVVSGKGSNEVSNPLDALYTTAIEASQESGGERAAQHIREYLGAIIVCSTRTPLSVDNLGVLLGKGFKKSVLQSVVNRLGSVLYADDAQSGAVRVYHQSFTDYMISSAPPQFRVDVELQNTNFARSCLRTMLDGLKFNMCGLKTSHTANRNVSDLSTRVNTAISLALRYSCLYWTSHLIQSKRGELIDMLKGFMLEPPVLYWIEVLSLLGKLEVAMFSALEVSKWCEGLNEIQKFAGDTYRFILAFYDPIAESTPHLYVSALAFCPARTGFAQRLGGSFQNRLTVTRGAEESWSPWLRCISQSGGVRAIAMSKDGRRIVSGSDDNTVQMWNADTGAALGNPLIGHTSAVNSVGFSPDGRRIVSGSQDMTVRVWDVDTGTALGDPLVGHSDAVWSVGFSPDGRLIVSGSDDKTLRVWDTDTGIVIGDPLAEHSDCVKSVGFSPDGRYIASGSEDNTVRVWNTDARTAVGDPLVGHTDTVWSVAFSPDGQRIVSSSADETVRLWDTDTGIAVGSPLVGHSDCVGSVGFSPDGRRIVSGSDDKTVRVWDADTSKPLDNLLVGHSACVWSVAFSPDGRRIISGSDDKTVRVWDADASTALDNPVVGYLGSVRSVGFSPDGRRIVSGSNDKTVRVWDADTGATLTMNTKFRGCPGTACRALPGGLTRIFLARRQGNIVPGILSISWHRKYT